MIDSLENVHILAPAGEQRVEDIEQLSQTVTDFDLGCAKQQIDSLRYYELRLIHSHSTEIMVSSVRGLSAFN